MSRADQIAIQVKYTIAQLERIDAKPIVVTLGYEDYVEVTTNKNVLRVPDLDTSENKLCGLRLVVTPELDRHVSVGVNFWTTK